MPQKTLISVVGQTALGKTKLAIELAKHFDTEIVSSDSRQFYKEMAIGTAVPSAEQLAAATHHFIQHLSIHDDYSVGDYEEDGLNLLDQLFRTKDVVVLVGGSGLYNDAITKGLDDFPDVPTEIRETLNTRLKKEGIVSLQAELEQLDNKQYELMDINNPHRLIRALEICIGTGKPYSSFLNKKKNSRSFKTVTVGLIADREIVYERINQRVDLMIKHGLLEEVQGLVEHKSLNALQTVGYKEFFMHLDGLYDFDFAVSEIKKNTRRFAKRQMTWFKKNESTLWVDYQYDLNKLIMDLKNNIPNV